MAECVWCGRRKKLFERFNKYGFCIDCKCRVQIQIDYKIYQVNCFLSQYRSGALAYSDEEMICAIDRHLTTLDELEELRKKVPMFKSNISYLNHALERARTAVQSKLNEQHRGIQVTLMRKPPDASNNLDKTRARLPALKKGIETIRKGLLKAKLDLREFAQAVQELKGCVQTVQAYSNDDSNQVHADSELSEVLVPAETPAIDQNACSVISECDLNPPDAEISSSNADQGKNDKYAPSLVYAAQKQTNSRVHQDAEPIKIENHAIKPRLVSPSPVLEKKTLIIPQEIENYEIAYCYRDVFVVGVYHANPDFNLLHPGDSVELVPDPNNEVDKKAVKVMCNEQQVGFIASKRETLQRMVHQWAKKKAPVFSAITSMDEDEKKINIVVCFYRDKQEILNSCDTIDTKLIKTSKKDECGDSRQENIAMLSVGDILDAVYDWETETYIITNDSGFEMGELSKDVSLQLQEEDEDYYPYIVVEDVELNKDLKYIVKVKIYLKHRIK